MHPRRCPGYRYWMHLGNGSCLLVVIMKNPVDRYLDIVEWARKRYTTHGVLVMDAYKVPSIYFRICDAAFARYIQEYKRGL